MYPEDPEELTRYLQNHPELNVVLPTGHTIYTFQRRDGNRIEFATRDQRVVTLHLDAGQIEYHTNGFTRRVGRFTGEFLYAGSKPWQAACEEEKAA
jgi:hypothetical protein